MKANDRSVPAKFRPETRFEVRPEPAAPFRRLQEDRFEDLKRQVLAERLENTPGRNLGSYLRRAANEAAALAWVTPYPLLVFPALFEEHADAAVLQAERQEEVRQRSRELLAV